MHSWVMPTMEEFIQQQNLEQQGGQPKGRSAAGWPE
jgi:hypothetical protein